MSAVTYWRIEVRLVPNGQMLLKSHMKIRGLSAMDLAVLCGNRKYRSSIAHLISGGRQGCSEELAMKINQVILGDAAKDMSLFTARVSAVSRDNRTASERRAA